MTVPIKKQDECQWIFDQMEKKRDDVFGMLKKTTRLFLALFCFFGSLAFSAMIQVQIMTPIKKGNTSQIVSLSYEVVTKTPGTSPSLTLYEVPFPGVEPLKTRLGVSKTVFKDASENLYEEIDIELSSKQKKRVYQKLTYGGSELVAGQLQRLRPISRTELARHFVDNFKPEKTAESYSKAIFSLQNLGDQKEVFSKQCQFLKQQQLEVLQKVKIEKVVFDLLLEGICP